MKKFLNNLKSKEFHKKNWHRLLVAPILFFAIFIGSSIYMLSGGFYIVLYLSLVLGFAFSILFVINYKKKYFFALLSIVLLQIVTFNIDTSKYEYFVRDKVIHLEDKYYIIKADCFGLKKNYYETATCVGKGSNCLIETYDRESKKLLNTAEFSCKEYRKIIEEKKKERLEEIEERRREKEK